MPKAQETLLEINLTALGKNFHYLKSKISSETKFLGVVKAFAYGSDATIIAKELQNLGADYLAVAYTKEGVALRDAGIHIPIMVLHPQPNNLEDIIDRCLEPSIYSLGLLNSFLEVAKDKNQRQYPIHIKLNTGLNRLGFNPSDVNTIATILNQNSSIKALSVFSHLAASEDEEEKEFSNNQIALFNTLSNSLNGLLDYTIWKHMCNTSAILNYPEAHFNMVRSGIGLYGFGNCEKENQNLIPIASLKTVISQIHNLKDGDSLGYNRAFISKGVTKTATLPIGHADGISRDYGNGNAWVYIHQQKAPIIGNVCMDMIMVDITNIKCKVGDEVIIFGPHHRADVLAEENNSISYELITAISQRVKRVFYRN